MRKDEINRLLFRARYIAKSMILVLKNYGFVSDENRT